MKLDAEMKRMITDNRYNIKNLVTPHVLLKEYEANCYSSKCLVCGKPDALRIHEVKQLYHCMSCKSGGDLVTLVSDVCKVSRKQAQKDVDENKAWLMLKKSKHSEIHDHEETDN